MARDVSPLCIFTGSEVGRVCEVYRNPKAMGWGGWGKGEEKGGGKSWSPWQPMPLGR